MDWQTIAAFALVAVTLLGVNIAAVQWVMARRDRKDVRHQERLLGLEKDLNEIRVTLPLEYVRREDWIRFSSTLDGKIDRLRDEIRDEMKDLRGMIDGGRI
ncbi:MAG TPA: hypothetical protein VMV27_01960 [Candidatus Binataceae bacterium]|nr:hypothetical protein [Candidatus Binataceae bacterium]